jgi:hypothetical protein
MTVSTRTTRFEGVGRAALNLAALNLAALKNSAALKNLARFTI